MMENHAEIWTSYAKRVAGTAKMKRISRKENQQK